jgi:hypothetical protein
MTSTFKSNIKNNYINSLGWRSNRKYIVIQSDDWGAERVPSYISNKNLLHAGINLDKCHYLKYDSIASDDDLYLLFNLLSSFRDYKGNSPILNANIILNNPDFKKIKDSNYSNYFSVDLKETFQRAGKFNKKTLSIWNSAKKDSLFHPQLHGFHHLNHIRWLKYLRSEIKVIRNAFDLGIFGVSKNSTNEFDKSILAAFDYDEIQDNSKLISFLSKSFSDFNNYFDFHSKSFIAPNYVWSDEVERALKDNDVKFIQTASVQRIPGGTNNYKYKRHYTGKTNKYNQKYMMRNVIFEPSENTNIDWVDKCLKEIEIAFFWKKPAIISSHRVNYVGVRNEKNRDNSLLSLKELIKKSLKRWPDIEFVTTDYLGNLIIK